MATENASSQAIGPSLTSIPINLKTPPSTLSDLYKLTACLAKQSVIPSDADLAERDAALDLLENVILHGGNTEIRGHPLFAIVSIGSHGLGVYDAASNVDCLCVGHTSPKIFFTLAIQQLRKAAPRDIKILRRMDEGFGTILELQVNHIMMSLRYCLLSSVSITETWPAIEALSPDDPFFNVPSSLRISIKPLLDLLYLRRTIPDSAAFRLAYYVIKCWARRRGIYAPIFGYLGGIQISILLTVICKLLSQKAETVSVPAILTTFYDHYAVFDWKNSIVFDPEFHKQLKYVRTRQEPMVILGFHGPSLNTAQAASVPTVHVISEEFKRANKLLSEVGMTWPRFLGDGTDATEFLNTYGSYIKVTAQFWDVSLAKGNSFVDWLESRFGSIFTGLCRRIPHADPRIWPARFVEQEVGGDAEHEWKTSDEESTEYEGYYLVGLDTKRMTQEETAAALEQVQAALYDFETQIRSDPKHFDPKFFWMGAAIVPQSSVGKLRVDGRDWGKYAIAAEDDDLGDSEFWASMDADEEPSTSILTKELATRVPGGAASSTAKLRPAGDVLNRLRWDQAIDSSDYIVGYEDRFSGVMERSVNSWKSETTNEEFIPEHRIVYFKRKSDGVVVWDKEARRDEMFGSGLGRS
ncbi:hypothetical protein F4818DRAFT_148065 [Hypoxylon cercidicola]|nr:hypothetical protein F4818DRAFT_148065 [Hypoxylon cercidicola]